MPDILCNDFSQGWCPSDDPINGRKNALLQMDNLELDSNGALQLIGGTNVVRSYASRAHTLYSRVMGGTRRDYAALTDGSINRDGNTIVTGGDSSIAAFGTAFDYTLVCSGTKRIKDKVSSAANLGVGAPTAAPTLIDCSLDTAGCYSTVANLTANYAMFVGSATIVTSASYPSGGGHARPATISYLQLTADSNGDAVFQTYNGVGDPHDSSKFTPPSGTDYGYALGSDVFPFFGYVEDPYGCSVQIDVLLTAGNAYADQMENYYTYKIADLSQLAFDPYTGVFHAFIRRADFVRSGTTANLDWNNTYGVRITFHGASGQIINFLGVDTNPVDHAFLAFFGGTHALNGSYDFMQVNVNNTGTYLARSQMSPILKGVSIIQGQPQLGFQNPSSVDLQVNEIWIFARSNGGANGIGDTSFLSKWTRVAKVTSGSSLNTQLGDIEAEILNITYDENLVSIASTSITDKILRVLGPMNGRWYYFTSNTMYPSDINNPDLVKPGQAVRTTGSNSEIFLWAFEIAEGVVLVGTSVDVYILSGTFQTLADGSIDIYYRKLGCKFPPITYDADIYNGAVYYLANDGWRSINSNGDNPLLVAPNTDQLYKGKSRYGYIAPNLKISSGSVRFPICIARNKIFAFVTGTGRYEVYDFIRRYWRPVNYQLGDTSACFATQDGQILATSNSDNRLRELEVPYTKLIDGTTPQTYNALFCVFDGQLPRNRKDSQTFKTRAFSGGSAFNVIITSSDGVAASLGTVNTGAPGVDFFIDLSNNSIVAITKTYQVKLSGATPEFLLEDWVINFTPRPEQVTYFKQLNTNFGTGAKKKIANWPLVIDTLGNNVTYTPYVDDISLATTQLVSFNKDTKNIFFVLDQFNVDFGFTLHSSGLFEVYGPLDPEVLQVLPIAKRFDQLGPTELFRYGKVKKFELRLLAFGSSIPYILYFSDNNIYNGILNVTAGKEDTYFVDTPKGTSGHILRMVLGPTNFDFHRFYARVQVAESGQDTQLNWINL